MAILGIMRSLAGGWPVLVSNDISSLWMPLHAEMRVLELEARDPQAWKYLAEAYLKLAEDDPADHRLLANAARFNWLGGHSNLALGLYKRAVLLKPDCHVLYRGLGNALMDLGRFGAAERAYRFSMSASDNPETRWNLSQLLIGAGTYDRGYELAESRWRLPGVQPWRSGQLETVCELVAPGEPLLVWSEQGFGDIFQHLRWIPRLQRLRGPKAHPLHLEMEECLVGFLQHAYGAQHDQVLVHSKNEDHPMPWLGPHISLLSLPRLLGVEPLHDGLLVQEVPDWGRPAQGTGGRAARIGVVWAAGRKLESAVAAREYWLRSLDQDSLGRLLEGLNALGHSVVALQFGDDRFMVEPWLNLIDEMLPSDADFARTAELVAGLDLVISVDTSMAHLAGTLLMPVWVMLPFSAAPRWGTETTTSSWYPTMKLFRQREPWIWKEPIEQILQVLGTG